mmetsp:Transcript_27129/g.63506  ORF Transcript_27129/g.63506 Transcript_27129/m.63506 type:complete len:93 (+) Transcript_27129:244-522(+)
MLGSTMGERLGIALGPLLGSFIGDKDASKVGDDVGDMLERALGSETGCSLFVTPGEALGIEEGHLPENLFLYTKQSVPSVNEIISEGMVPVN